MPPKRQQQSSVNNANSEAVFTEETKKRKGTTSFQKTQNKLARVSSENKRQVNKVMSLESMGIQRQQQTVNSRGSSSSAAGPSRSSASGLHGGSEGGDVNELDDGTSEGDDEDGQQDLPGRKSRSRRRSVEWVHANTRLASNSDCTLVSCLFFFSIIFVFVLCFHKGLSSAR